MAVQAINGATATNKGTLIAQTGQGMDKNAFLKILSAELANQDPDNAQDSTAYITQMAQFTNIEQMSNLNDNLNFSSAASFIGKVVALNSYDSSGNQYGGTVKGAFKNSDGVYLNVEVSEGGKKVVKNFLYTSVTDVANAEPTTTTTTTTTDTTPTTTS